MSCKAFVDHMGIPVAHSLMGKGALPDDHPLTLGMTGFWGTKFINEKCRAADWVLALGTRFKEADCSSWEPEYTFSLPAGQAHPHRHRAERDRPQLPDRDRRVADLKQALKTLLSASRGSFIRSRAATRRWSARSPRCATAVQGQQPAMAESTLSR